MIPPFPTKTLTIDSIFKSYCPLLWDRGMENHSPSDLGGTSYRCGCLRSGIRCYRDSILVCRVEPGVCFPSSLANLELRTIPRRKCQTVETDGFQTVPSDLHNDT